LIFHHINSPLPRLDLSINIRASLFACVALTTAISAFPGPCGPNVHCDDGGDSGRQGYVYANDNPYNPKKGQFVEIVGNVTVNMIENKPWPRYGPTYCTAVNQDKNGQYQVAWAQRATEEFRCTYYE
jgi:hypothetical protein